ncbi:MAG: hypothetical protein ACLR3S_12775 [Clostridium fessum]
MDEKMAIIGAVLFVGGIGVTSIGAAIGGAAAGLDFLIDQEKNFRINITGVIRRRYG